MNEGEDENHLKTIKKNYVYKIQIKKKCANIMMGFG